MFGVIPSASVLASGGMSRLFVSLVSVIVLAAACGDGDGRAESVSTTSGVTFAVGPVLGGLTYDLADTYRPAFIGVAIVIGAGILLLTPIRAPKGRY